MSSKDSPPPINDDSDDEFNDEMKRDGRLKRLSIEDESLAMNNKSRTTSTTKTTKVISPKPPSSKPPPVPIKNSIKKFSKIGDGIEADEVHKMTNMKRIKKRRRSLPIFPTINQLKSVMGFGTDDRNETILKKNKKNKKNKDNNNNNNSNENNDDNDILNSNNDLNNNSNDDDINFNDNNNINDTNNTYDNNKMLHIRNLKLQHQVDKFRTKSKELETEVILNKQLRAELNNQINNKNKIIKSQQKQVSILYILIL